MHYAAEARFISMAEETGRVLRAVPSVASAVRAHGQLHVQTRFVSDSSHISPTVPHARSLAARARSPDAVLETHPLGAGRCYHG